jgi:hypothetical protein
MTEGKRCPKCGEVKPLSEFYALRNGRTGSYCKPCTKADVLRWARENPVKFRQTQRRSALKRQYGLTEDNLAQMLAAQDGRCPICGVTLAEVVADVDHDHETGRVRGVLCHRCNRTIGLFGDDPLRLRAAAQYLRRTDKTG